MIDKQWRITKYDPRFRDHAGRYRADDWTDVSDIGKIFNGTQLTVQSYLDIENRYVASVLCFMKETGISRVMVKRASEPLESQLLTEYGLANVLIDGATLKVGDWISGSQVDRACRLTLRSLQGFQLEYHDRFFVHFGYDYYMYVGSCAPCTDSVRYASGLGLFVESFTSPIT